MTDQAKRTQQDMLTARFSDAPPLLAACPQSELISSMLGRGSCRDFTDAQVPQDVVELLCASAMASPTKSDLQGRDIVLLRAPKVKARLIELVSGQAWVAGAPMIAVFCGNNRRQRLLHDWHSIPFANNHLDALFNAVGDAAIALGAFVTAAEALGLGCCPISAVRNEAQAVSDLLELPSHVFPFAGLAFGYPENAPKLSKRLPLGVTCHVDRYSEQGVAQSVRAYDQDRASSDPYPAQRFVERFGASSDYGWSEDKARQYSAEERADFGAYLRAQGFRMD